VEHLTRTLHLEYSTSLTLKHLTKLEKLARDKHSSLLRRFVNYGKKSYNIRPRRDAVTNLPFPYSIKFFIFLDKNRN
jgi:hypothetical protein